MPPRVTKEWPFDPEASDDEDRGNDKSVQVLKETTALKKDAKNNPDLDPGFVLEDARAEVRSAQGPVMANLITLGNGVAVDVIGKLGPVDDCLRHLCKSAPSTKQDVPHCYSLLFTVKEKPQNGPRKKKKAFCEGSYIKIKDVEAFSTGFAPLTLWVDGAAGYHEIQPSKAYRGIYMQMIHAIGIDNVAMMFHEDQLSSAGTAGSQSLQDQLVSVLKAVSGN